MKRLFMLSLAVAFGWGARAQVTERERPSDWKYLVEGARFMDRLQPMKGEVLSADVWGADSVRPRLVDNGIELAGTSFWGGNILREPDGKYHLFVCGWPENSPKGHMFWPNSTVYHAVGERLEGPYTVRDTIGKGHNPEAFRLADGRVVVYVIDGYYIAPSVKGPWQYRRFTFNTRNRNIVEGLSNLTFARRPDGSYLMVCRGGGVWISRDGLAPYEQLSDRSVYPPVEGRFEDPVVWRDSLQYHLIVNDWLGRIAYYQRSKDGLHWVTEQGEAYVPGVSVHPDGRVEHWFKYERPKVFQDESGRAVQMNFAVIDTIKWEDQPNDNHSSKNICIPLNPGLRLEVLNKEPITAGTKAIEVRIRAEQGFNPQKDIDVRSLRFGSFTEVNFGRGSKVVRTRKEGKDLIAVFDGAGSGIGPDEFAPKLLGRGKKGGLLYGYASLPYVDYRPAMLSAAYPMYDKERQALILEVKNYGLSSSRPSRVVVQADGRTLAEGEVGKLLPYGVQELRMKTAFAPTAKELSTLTVVFYTDGQEVRRDILRY